MSAQAAVVYSESNRVVASEGQVQEALEAVVNWAKYDGERVTGTNSPVIYLVWNGHLRAVPDAATYSNLFVSPAGVVISDYLVDNIPAGQALTSGALLIKGQQSVEIYLLTDNKKSHIPNSDTFNKFHFNSAKVVVLSQTIVNAIPQGANIG